MRMERSRVEKWASSSWPAGGPAAAFLPTIHLLQRCPGLKLEVNSATHQQSLLVLFFPSQLSWASWFFLTNVSCLNFSWGEKNKGVFTLDKALKRTDWE